MGWDQHSHRYSASAFSGSCFGDIPLAFVSGLIWDHGAKALSIKYVPSTTRNHRSTRELLDLIERIGKAGASFRRLGDPFRDTSTSQGRLLSTLLAAIAEFERDLIRERTGDGRKRAQAAGVKFGRKPKLSEFQRQEALKRRAAGETLAEIAKSYAVDISMISRAKYVHANTGKPWSAMTGGRCNIHKGRSYRQAAVTRRFGSAGLVVQYAR